MPSSPQAQDRLRPFLRELVHAVNSPLGVILGTTQFVLSDFQGKQPGAITETDLRELVESLSILERQARRSAQLIQNMRALCVAGQLEIRPTSINECLRQAIAGVHWAAARIEVAEELAEGLPTISADAPKLVEAFTAIALNASEAMPNGGRFRVASRLAGSAIEVIFEDTGIGINEKDLPKVFSPSFSRKKGEGRGMGLAVAALILDAHGAQTALHSQPGRGTAVTLHFPLSPAPAQTA